MLASEYKTLMEPLQPILSGQKLYPAYSHLWFRRGSIEAFNGAQLCIVACDHELDADLLLVPGDLFSRLVGSLGDVPIVLTVVPGGVAWKAGKVSGRLAVLNEESLKETPGIPSDVVWVDGNEELRRALESVHETTDSSDYVQTQGVRLIVKGGSVSTFCTDNVTMARCVLATKFALPNGVYVLPPTFVDVLSRLNGPYKFAVWETGVAVEVGGKALLISSLLPESLKSIEDIFNNCYVDGTRITLPQGIAEALNRVAILVADGLIEIGVSENGVLQISARSDFGEIQETFQLPAPQKPASAVVNTKLFARALGYASDIVALDETPSTVILQSDKTAAGKFVYILAQKG
jgi:hypothetical protein